MFFVIYEKKINLSELFQKKTKIKFDKKSMFFVIYEKKIKLSELFQKKKRKYFLQSFANSKAKIQISIVKSINF